MKPIFYYAGTEKLALTVLLVWALPLWAQGPVATTAENPQSEIAVQARGPIHEAFAQPTDLPPQPGPIIDKKPPDPIPEQPPDVKPEGDNVQWIPGYWAWSDDRHDFLWVSGVWRVSPPNRKWVPGYWNQVGDGWQWVHGFWAPNDEQEIPYVPEAPPASLENGPAAPAPDDNSTYVPGCWVFREERYLWRPGYWVEAQPGYLWTNSYYCETPAGYVYVEGYWDHPLEDRGLLFAPVVFNQPLWQNPDWYFQPASCLDVANLLPWLFVRPGWHQYCYGDFFGNGYRRAGYRPWALYGERHHDALFSYYRRAHRNEPGWSRGLVGRARGHGGRGAPSLVRSLADVRRSGALHLVRVNSSQMKRARDVGRLYHESGRTRARWEGRHAGRTGHAALPLSSLPAVARHGRPATPQGRHGSRSSPPSAPRGTSPRPHTVPQGPNRHHASSGPRRPTPNVRPNRPENHGVGPRPAPHNNNRPAPHVNRPAPHNNRPAPHANRPAPHNNRPATHGNRPAPHKSRPAPRSGSHASRPARKPAPRPAHKAPAHGNAKSKHH